MFRIAFSSERKAESNAQKIKAKIKQVTITTPVYDMDSFREGHITLRISVLTPLKYSLMPSFFLAFGFTAGFLLIYCTPLFGFSVKSMLLAKFAILAVLYSIRIIFLALHRVIISLFAFSACQRHPNSHGDFLHIINILNII